MSNLMEKSLIVRKETIFDKLRKSLFALIYAKDYQMMENLDKLITPKRPTGKIIIPKEIGKN